MVQILMDRVPVRIRLTRPADLSRQDPKIRPALPAHIPKSKPSAQLAQNPPPPASPTRIRSGCESCPNQTPDVELAGRCETFPVRIHRPWLHPDPNDPDS